MITILQEQERIFLTHQQGLRTRLPVFFKLRFVPNFGTNLVHYIV